MFSSPGFRKYRFDEVPLNRTRCFAFVDPIGWRSREEGTDQIHSTTCIGKPLYGAELKLKDFLVHWQTMMAWRKASRRLAPVLEQLRHAAIGRIGIVSLASAQIG
jgi:hypothetical protein